MTYEDYLRENQLIDGQDDEPLTEMPIVREPWNPVFPAFEDEADEEPIKELEEEPVDELAEDLADEPVEEPVKQKKPEELKWPIKKEEKKVEHAKSVIRTSPSSLIYPTNGPRKVYKYWDSEKREWFPSMDKTAALQAGNGLVEEAWVFFKDGSIDHELTSEEIRKYLP